LPDIIVNSITPKDHDRWAELWCGYLNFYETSLPRNIYDHTWQRLIAGNGPICGFGARFRDATAPLVGIAHYLFHAHAWTTKEVCYLQDLFVDAPYRQGGVGGRLIAAVAAAARDRGCFRLYWSTREDNASARSLYDRVARFNGFIRYDYPLE
jgi:GNAT superfamily N-acetyltransferase